MTDQERDRASRLEVLSVAMGDHMGLQTPALKRLAREAVGVALGDDPKSPVVKVADAFDKMAFVPGGSRSIAMAYLHEKVGVEFDADVVGALGEVEGLVQPMDDHDLPRNC